MKGVLASARRAQEVIARDRARIYAKALVEVEQEWAELEARQAVDTAERNAMVEVHRERRAHKAQAEARTAELNEQEQDEMAKAKAASRTRAGSTDFPSGPAHYWHMHHSNESFVGPTHRGTVKGDLLVTDCGKKLNAKYWRVTTHKIDCGDCLGGAKNGSAPKAVKVNGGSKVKRAATRAVKNYSGKAKTKRAVKVTSPAQADATIEEGAGK